MILYKMYPTFRHTFVCSLCTKVVLIVLLILYAKCIQNFVEIWYTFCIHFVYILYTSIVYILCNFGYKMYTQFPCG